MPPRNRISPEKLLQTLRANPQRGTKELATVLGASTQSVRRLLAELPANTLLSSGHTNRTRYALRRPLRGVLEDLPLYAIDEAGQARSLGPLALVQPEGTLLSLDGTGWPVPTESKDGWWDGLPYPVYAVRPHGYMGRQLARAEHRALDVSEDPEEWSDDDILWVLSRRGSDVTGNLLLGNAALELWLKNKVRDMPVLPTGDRRRHHTRSFDTKSMHPGVSKSLTRSG